MIRPFAAPFHTTYSVQPSENIQIKGEIYREYYPAVHIEILDQVLRGIQSNDSSPIYDGHPVTQPLCLLHIVSSEKDGLASVAYITDQIPHHPATPRVQASSQLIQKDQLRIVDQS